jgi:hypothetical protein
MPHADPHGPSDVGRIVEKQMRNWELARAQHLGQRRAAAAPPDVADFVTISRTLASGGSEVAALLGERLHWPVFDRELLHAMAGDDQVRARVYAQLDERDESWIEGAMHWIIAGELRTDDYFRRLSETILALARQGRAVFLGRAADLILPRAHGLRIRITAPLAPRAQAFARENNIPEALARDQLERIDHQREDFRRRHFGPTANDDTRQDLLLNLANFGPPQAVDVIVAALRARGIAM